MNRGKRLNTGFIAHERDFDINVRMVELGRNFDLTLGGLHMKHAVYRSIWLPTQNLL
jgi:hypothetical protein